MSIVKARKGLAILIKNPQVLHLIRDYSISDESKERIRNIQFENHEPFFFVKIDNESLFPAQSLSRLALNADDDILKWFLLLYFISSDLDLLDKMIINMLDPSISSQWKDEHYGGHGHFDLYGFPKWKIGRLCDDIFDMDNVLSRLFSSEDHYKYFNERYRRSVALFSLTAGYHFFQDFKTTITPNLLSSPGHDIQEGIEIANCELSLEEDFSDKVEETIPVELFARKADLPLILSGSMYISVITGDNFYDVLRGLLKENGTAERLDDVILMAKKNKAIEELKAEKANLLSLLDKNKELRRQQETAGDIIAKTWGQSLPKEMIEDRVKKCNEAGHRQVLYKLESLTMNHLSFTDRISDTALTENQIESITKEYGVVLSNEEKKKIVTIEDYVDTLFCHLRFIDDFKQAILNNGHIGGIAAMDPYSLEVRIKEIEMLFGGGIDRSIIHSIEDLRQYVSENNQLLKKVISFIAEKLGLGLEEVTLNSSFFMDLGADSLDYVEMVMDVERLYGIRISDEEASNIKTVKDIYTTVLDKIRGREEFSQMMKVS